MRYAAAIAAAASALLWNSKAEATDLPRLAVSADGRTLMKGNQPFFWMGDTAWRLHRLTMPEIDQYLDNRRSKGFNIVQGPNLHSTHANVFGETNPDHTTPNEAWFAYIDQIVERCAEHHMYISLTMTWGGAASQFTVESAYDYGLYVGQRYREHTNLAAFIVSGEFNHPNPNVPIWSAIAEGLQDGLAGAPVMLTALPRWYGWFGGQSSSYDLHTQPWLSFNMHQSSLYGDCSNNPTNLYYMGTHNWLLAEHDWPLTPTKPFVDAEATYEQQSPLNAACEFNPPRWPAFGVRRRAYWSVFAGATGHTYGANGVFQFYKPGDTEVDWAPNDFWTVAIDYPGAFNMTHLHRLMRSRPLAGRIPAQDLLLEGTTELVPIHVHATRDADGSFAMVYVPEVNRLITLNMNILAGEQHRMWWFNPMDGQATLIGKFTRADYLPHGKFIIATPDVGEDWVLVVDDAAAGYAAPGSAELRTPGDATGDDSVDVADVLAVIGAWGPCAPVPQPCMADVSPFEDGDRLVNVADLLQVISNWGSGG